LFFSPKSNSGNSLGFYLVLIHPPGVNPSISKDTFSICALTKQKQLRFVLSGIFGIFTSRKC